MSRGVEVAGFRFAPQSQSSHCSLGAVALLVSIDSFASLRFQRRPTPPGRRSARSPTTFGSRSKDIVSFSGYYHLFPGISAYLQTVLNWTFGIFLQFYRFNHPLQPTGLQHDRTALFYIPSATHFASSTFRSSLAFNSSSA